MSFRKGVEGMTSYEILRLIKLDLAIHISLTILIRVLLFYITLQG